MEFIQAKWYTPVAKRNLDLAVIHSMEAPEKGDTAEAVARYFQTLPSTRKASAHYCIDNNSIVQCVKDMDVAYAAPGANHNGLHFEHAGYAKQSEAEWTDAYGQQMLSVSAHIVAEKCIQYNIPMAFVNERELRKGYRGITTHWEVTKAFGIVGGHTDPGPNFPMSAYITLVQNVADNAIHQEVRVESSKPIVTIMARPQNDGYWEVASDGGVFGYGGAKFHGSLGGVALNKPIVDGAPTSTGEGYWLVAEDGGVFAFGDAAYVGSVEYKG